MSAPQLPLKCTWPPHVVISGCCAHGSDQRGGSAACCQWGREAWSAAANGQLREEEQLTPAVFGIGLVGLGLGVLGRLADWVLVLQLVLHSAALQLAAGFVFCFVLVPPST